MYLLRGWLGVFSTGIDTLRSDLEGAGVRAAVYRETQESELARRIGDAYAGVAPEAREPLVLVGHSYGADASIGIARALASRGIKVDLIITLDPVTPEPVPGNVVRVHNFYQSNGVLDRLPWWRGVPLTHEATATSQPATELRNMDLRQDRPDLKLDGLDHANIEDQPAVRAEVLAEVLKVCPPREVWSTQRRPLSGKEGSAPSGK